jgi:hypothetical protein
MEDDEPITWATPDTFASLEAWEADLIDTVTEILAD